MAHLSVVDAHALVWFLVDSPRLGAKASAILSDPNSTLYLPIIALAEVCWLVEKGKAPTIPSVSALLAAVDADKRVVIVPLEREILDLSHTLTVISEMHDRLIVATALWLAASGESPTLLTCDGNITASGLVSTVW